MSLIGGTSTLYTDMIGQVKREQFPKHSQSIQNHFLQKIFQGLLLYNIQWNVKLLNAPHVECMK